MTTEQEFQRLQSRTESELRAILHNPMSREESRAAGDALQELHALKSQAILAEFNKATPAFVAHTELLQKVDCWSGI
ncbi:MAG: hypothetical protein AAF637_06485 [Pseudomonadota bacterium]